MAALVIPTLNCQRHGAFRVRHQAVPGFILIIVVTIVVEVKAEDRAAVPVPAVPVVPAQVDPAVEVQAQVDPAVDPAVLPMEATMMVVIVAVGVETQMTTKTTITTEAMIPTREVDKVMAMTMRLSSLTKTCTAAIRNMIQSTTSILKW